MATIAPRMAAHEAARGEIAAAPRAMLLQGFERVGGASGCEAASAAQPRAEKPAVELNDADEDFLQEAHAAFSCGESLPNKASSSARNVALSAGDVALGNCSREKPEAKRSTRHAKGNWDSSSLDTA